ncbi:MAG: VOC family protein [Gemmatimonadales bacterium]|nr:VOC family protein [Gemmatimonadales bacterium]
MIRHVQSFAIFVNDLDRATAFYRDALELPINKQGSFGLELFHEPPHVGIHPAVHPDSKALVGRHTGITFHVPGLLHFSGTLHDRGVKFLTEPTKMSWGVMAMIADPEGNVFALWDDEVPPDET